MKFLILDNSDKKMLFEFLKTLENNYFVEVKKRETLEALTRIATIGNA